MQVMAPESGQRDRSWRRVMRVPPRPYGGVYGRSDEAAADDVLGNQHRIPGGGGDDDVGRAANNLGAATHIHSAAASEQLLLLGMMGSEASAPPQPLQQQVQQCPMQQPSNSSEREEEDGGDIFSGTLKHSSQRGDGERGKGGMKRKGAGGVRDGGN